MGVWSTIEGEVTYPRTKHISLHKAIKHFMEDYAYDHYLKVDRYREINGIVYVGLYLTIEYENIDAANFFSKLLEFIKSMGCRTHLTAEIPFIS